MKKTLVAYMPVLHAGYLDFVKRHPDAQEFFIFSRSVVSLFDWLMRKDIRAVEPDLMAAAFQAALRKADLTVTVRLLEDSSVKELCQSNGALIFADEEESRHVASTFFSGCNVSFDKIFLRWDKPRVLDGQHAEGFPVTQDELHKAFIKEGLEAAAKSSDWWLGVGAVLVAGNQTIIAYNRHLPSEHTPYVFGDPRSLFKKGIHVELTSVLHSEVAVVGTAARNGISTMGARLYVTTFPCPFCAAVLSESGISEIYFHSGYSMLDGVATLERKGIKLFRVAIDERPT